MSKRWDDSPWPGRAAIVLIACAVLASWHFWWRSLDGPHSYKFWKISSALSLPSVLLLFAAGFYQDALGRRGKEDEIRAPSERLKSLIRGVGLTICTAPHLLLFYAGWMAMTWLAGLLIVFVGPFLVPASLSFAEKPARYSRARRRQVIDDALRPRAGLSDAGREFWAAVTDPASPLMRCVSALGEGDGFRPTGYDDLRDEATLALGGLRTRLRRERPPETGEFLAALDRLEVLVKSL